MSWPVARAKAAWICGDREWAIGLPMTAYLSKTISLGALVKRGVAARLLPAQVAVYFAEAAGPLGYLETSASALVNVHVRVTCRTSVSRLMSDGNCAKGADISTILVAAASRMRLRNCG